MPRTPTEFAKYLKEFGVRSFDEYAARRSEHAVADAGSAADSPDSAPRALTPLDRLAAHWNSLTGVEKTQFFDRLIEAGAAMAATAPALVRRARKRRPAAKKKAPKAEKPAAVEKKKNAKSKDKDSDKKKKDKKKDKGKKKDRKKNKNKKNKKDKKDKKDKKSGKNGQKAEKENKQNRMLEEGDDRA